MANGAPPPTFEQYAPQPNTAATQKERGAAASTSRTQAATEASRASAQRTTALTPLEVKEKSAKAELAGINLETARMKLDKARKAVEAMPPPEKLDEARNVIMVELQNALEAKKLSRDMTGASGFAYDMTSGISGSPGASVNALLKPIKSNTAFNRIKKMRTEESPTGAALGAVSDKELDLLVSSEAAIDPAAGDNVFQGGLDTVIGNRIEMLMKLGADPLEIARLIPPEDLPIYKDKFRAYRFLETDLGAMNKYLEVSRKDGTYDPADFAELMGQAYFNATGRKPNQEFFEGAFNTGIKYLENPDATLNAFDYSQADADIQERIGSAGYKEDGLTWGETLGGAAINFVPSTFELAFDTVKALTVNLPETIDGVVDVIGGATGLSDDPTAWEALKNYYSDRYGSIEGFKRALRTDPASIAADVAGVLTGGATIIGTTANVAAKTSKISALSNAAKASEAFTSMAGKIDPLSSAAAIAKKGAGLTKTVGEAAAIGAPARYAGTTTEAVKQAFDAGKRGSTVFTEQMTGVGDAAAPVTKAEAALTELYQGRSQNYQRRMAALQKSEEVSFDDVDAAINKARQVGTHKGIDISAAADVWDEVGTKVAEFRDQGLNTLEDFDAMKRAVKTISNKYQRGTPQFKVANDVANAINDVIVEKAPVYANIMKDYRQASDTLADVKASLSIGNVSPDVTLRKLLRTAEGRGPRGTTVLQILEKTPSGKGLGDMLAGQALSGTEASGFAASATAPAALLTGSPEVLAAAAMSPRYLGEKAYGAGQVVGPAERLAARMAQTAPAQRMVELAEKYGPTGMAATRLVNPTVIQPMADPAAISESVPLSEAAAAEYSPPFPTMQMEKPGAMSLENYYTAAEKPAFSLDEYRKMIAEQPVVVNQALPEEEEEEEPQPFARGGLAVAPIALQRGGRPKKQTSWYDDLTMAVSRRSNDLVAAAADLADKYGLTPAQSAAWVAKQMGRSPQEVAAIRRNLGGVGNFRNVVNAGAASNEQRFRQQGGRGSRAPDMAAPPVRMADVAYRAADIPRAVVSETPRALEAAGNYIRNTTPQQAMQDARRAGGMVVDMVKEDPYGFAFDMPFYAAFPKSAATSDFAAMRGASRTLEPYASDPEAAQAKRMVDALSVLPLGVAPYAARRMLPSAARRVSRR